MRQARSGAHWDAEFSAGKYEFLKKPAEQMRLDTIAAMIAGSVAEHGPCEVVDVGCGEGLLLPRLSPPGVTRYVGLDISAVALERLPEADVPVVRVRASLAGWDGTPLPAGRRILVASEVLYYDQAAVGDLARAAERVSGAGNRTDEAIISCVAAHPDKPNWAAASDRLWAELAATGWPETGRERLVDPATGIAWDIARYRV
ncbi:MAG: class I SAM-dependent methyltransferase [Pseudomonadota bacterium]|nr:class I SAM-dependent methyltransferase [Pseudomonadota bacterium]